MINFRIATAACATFLLAATACGSKVNTDTATTVPAATDTIMAAPQVETPQAAVEDTTYTTTASGLKYKVLKEGTGKQPKATDNVTVHYEGKLLDGTIFDSSYQRGEPTTFPLNRVIPGWTEGVQLMKEGAVYEFYIPYQLAYGEMGTPGGPIGPKADLIFKVELIKVE